MNLVISLITLVAALGIRAHTLSLAAVVPHAIEVVALGIGGILGAQWSARVLTRLADHRLEQAVALLLAGIGVLLIFESFLAGQRPALLAADPTLLIISGIMFGLAIGAVAALLGVAGGDPTEAVRGSTIHAAEFPLVVKAACAGVWDFDAAFEFGLETNIAGLAARPPKTVRSSKARVQQP